MATTGSKRRSRIRRVLWCAGAVFGVVLAVLILVTQTPIAGRLLLPRLANALNAEVTAERVRIGFDGVVRMTNVKVSAHDVDGAAGDVLQIDGLRADVDWLSTLAGSPAISSVVFDKPVARVSVAEGTSKLNIGSMMGTGGMKGPGTLPRVTVRDGRIEFGEHNADAYNTLKRVRIDGSLVPTSGSGRYVIRLDGTSGSELSRPIDLNGEIDPDRVLLSVKPVMLEDWPASSVPSGVRDLYAALDMSGSVRELELAYTEENGIASVVVLEDVAITLPFDATGEDRAAHARMTRVNGTIRFAGDGVRASLRGLLEDLPYDVTIDWKGTSVNSAFEAEISTDEFRIAERPLIAPFAPRLVREKLATFGGPTAVVDATIQLRRGEPVDGRAGDIAASGTIDLRDGEAAYAGFPYAFTGLTGQATFDPDSVHIVKLEGTGPNGGTISATGVIAPPDDKAAVDIEVIVRGVPIDSDLERALPQHHRGVARALFNRDRYRDLVEAGLVMSPARARELTREAVELRRLVAADPDNTQRRAELRTLEALLDRSPVFHLGGHIDADIHVKREYGTVSNWTRDITVRLPDAGILPEHFPYPILGRRIEVKINDEQAVLGDEGVYLSLNNEPVRVGATVGMKENARGIDVHVEADDIAVDEYLLHALPDTEATDLSAGAVLRQLDVRGSIACVATVRDEDLDGELEYDVAVDLDGVEARPGYGQSALLINNLRGNVRATNTLLTADIQQAELAVIGSDGAESSAGSASLSASVPYPDVASGEATIEVVSAEASTPIEAFIEVLDQDAASRIAELRDRFDPRGRMNVNAEIKPGEDGEPIAEAVITAVEDLDIGAFGGRLGLSSTDGRIRVVGDRSPIVAFDSFKADVSFDTEPACSVSLDGVAPLSDQGEGSLDITLDSASFESALVRGVLAESLDENLLETYESLDPRGGFSLDATLGAGRDLSGMVRPESASVVRNGRRIEIRDMTGGVGFGPGGGVFDELSGTGGDWSFALNGAWQRTDESTSVHAELALRADSLNEDLVALVPSQLGEVVGSTELRIEGPLRLSGTTIDLSAPSDGSEPLFNARGTLEASGVSARVGLPVTEGSGRIDFQIERSGVDAFPRFEAEVLADEFRYAKLKLSSARAHLRSGEERGSILVPVVSGNMHGGRVSAHASVRPMSDADESQFEATVGFADVRLASVLNDLDEDIAPALDDTPDEQRGRVDAEVSLAGIIGDTGSLRGRGVMRVHGGRVIDLPTLLPLIEVANLRLPTAERLDFAEADLYIDGRSIAFEDLSVHSSNVWISGYGTAQMPDMDLDMVFVTRAQGGIPLISEVLEGVQSELLRAHVTGRPGDEKVDVKQFAATRRLIEELLGVEASSEERRLREIERSRLGRSTARERDLSDSIRKSGGE